MYFNDEKAHANTCKSDIGYCTVQLLNNKGLIDQGTFEFLRADKITAEFSTVTYKLHND